MKLCCDNQVDIHIASNTVFYRIKHREADCHFIWEMIQQGFVSTKHVRTGK